MTFIIWPDQSDPTQLGGKAMALAALNGTGIRIPAWFVVGPAAFYALLSAEAVDRLSTAGGESDARAILDSLEFSDTLRDRLNEAIAELCPDHGRVAVRSSAQDEDSDQYSFAGQLQSFLNVESGDVAAKVRAVWRSAFDERVYAYRRQHDLAGPPSPPAVIVQRMVAAQSAGVTFSADPVSGRRQIAVVAAVHGLGEALVSGQVDADTFRVDRDGHIVERQPVSADHPVLQDEQVLAVAALARQTARHFGRPQDVEWVIEDDKLFLLQSRPITSLARVADPDGIHNLWDNSNIVESYGGVTTPLTYSFARHAYEEVYREFCRILGVSDAVIEANQPVFSCMIGLIRGRIYYNLLNWYRVLAMLPGFKANQGFMEQMMGVKEGLPDELAESISNSSAGERWADRIRFGKAVVGLIWSFGRLNARKRAFERRLRTALGPQRPDLSTWRADELVNYYRKLEQQLLKRWDAPLLNDFYAMIFFGLLSKLVGSWAGDEAGTLQNDLLTGEGGMISAEPALQIQRMARLAAADPAFAELLRSGSLPAIRRALPGQADFAAAYANYLDRFGERCADELKLESRTLYDDPLPLLRAVGRLADRRLPDEVGSELSEALRREAEAHVRATLARRPLHRGILFWVLKHARILVRDRENLRFERTRVFGRARHILREVGERFYGVDLLNEPDQVFYLTVDEILGYVEGTASSTDLQGVAAVRQAEFANYEKATAPDERFDTYGMVYLGNPFRQLAESQSGKVGPTGDMLQGIGCCPGIVRGRARLVDRPLGVELVPGDILVTERTDPSWILIMPAAAGILVERGSTLSHTAIVSRELGIPSIVALGGIMDWLTEGELIEFDGRTGVVRKQASLSEEAV